MHRSRLRSFPIRLRIALAILAVSAGALVLMSTAVYLRFEADLKDNLDDTVRAQLETRRGLLDGAGRLPAVQQPNEDAPVLRVYGAGAEVLQDLSPGLAATADERALVARAAAEGDALSSVRYGREELRVAAGRTSGGATVVVGILREPVTEPLAQLRTTLGIAVAVTVVGLAGASFEIARRALRPIREITRTARTISSGQLDRRIEGATASDEVGELAVTFNAMLDRLAAGIERERRFIADASHELRTPLAALETALDVTLSRPRQDEVYRTTLEDALAQSKSLSRLVRQLLLLSRMDSGAQAIEFAAVDLADLVSAVAEGFAADHPRARLRYDAAEPGACVSGDAELLVRVIANILENAFVHGGDDVEVDVRLEERGRHVILTFADDGPGIRAAVRGAVFRRFQRGADAGGRPGSGLGLAIVESIVQLHGGAVDLPEVARGTTVRVVLPRLGQP